MVASNHGEYAFVAGGRGHPSYLGELLERYAPPRGRDARGEHFAGVTPKTFRKTVASVITREYGIGQAGLAAGAPARLEADRGAWRGAWIADA
ncbi:hypothetical protein GCM10009764_77850 [Nocardia ninae]|uniref:Uncharacterized protein n=1 Tax=Nocardia ninae NBRC 108245 TaxID=1210091 RepID=A0A511MCX4_9NOCA|nr:hypothetical protein NN4_30430 [Nocardia ninae NBRC 108245]